MTAPESICISKHPGIQPDAAFRIVSLLAVIGYPLFVLVCIAVFVRSRVYSTFTRKRSLFLFLCYCFATIPIWIVTCVYDYVGSESFPCAVFTFLFYFSFPLYNIPLTLKFARYLNDVALGRLVYEARQTSTRSVEESVAEMLKGDSSLRAFAAHFRVAYFASRDSADRVLNAKFLQTKAFFGMYLVIVCLPYVIAYFIRLSQEPTWYNGCYGCEIGTVDAAFFIAMVGLIVILAVRSNTLRITKRDPLHIIRECLLCSIVGVISILGFALFIIDPGNAYQKGVYNFRSIQLFVCAACVYIQSIHQVVLARQLKTKLVGSKNLDREDLFIDVMNDKRLKGDLRNYLNSELSSEILMFLDACDEYKSQFAQSDRIATERRKRIIYDNHIKKNSRYEVNISSILRDDLLSRMGEEGEITRFDKAYNDVKQELLRDGFPRYLDKLAKTENKVQNLAKIEATSIVTIVTDSGDKA
jgi:hypothetical protein